MEFSLFTKEKVYEIAYSIENGYERKELTDEEGKTILNSMNDLQIFSNICIYANCIKSSIKELKVFLLSLKFNQHSYIDFANAQRLTLNMLSHFYSFIKYCEGNVTQFKNQIAPHTYDSFFSYRLFYNMRNFLTHSELGITTFQTTLGNDGNYKTDALFDTLKLENDRSCSASFKKELKELKTKKVSILENIDSFVEAINKELFDIFVENTKKITENFILLRNDIVDNKCKGDINCSLKDPNGIIHGPFKSINVFLMNFSNEVIYANELHKNPSKNEEVYLLFLFLSFVYFKEKDVALNRYTAFSLFYSIILF